MRALFHCVHSCRAGFDQQICQSRSQPNRQEGTTAFRPGDPVELFDLTEKVSLDSNVRINQPALQHTRGEAGMV